jgi:hypothetical protein
MNRTLMGLLVVALALPSAGHAQQTNAPPGNSAIDEYLETVPGATGAKRPRPPREAGGGVLTPAQRTQLERQGADGKALADAIDATAPAGAPAPANGENRAADTEARSPASGVLDAVSGNDGDGGMGFVLPVILVAALVGAIALTLLRRRATS